VVWAAPEFVLEDGLGRARQCRAAAEVRSDGDPQRRDEDRAIIPADALSGAGDDVRRCHLRCTASWLDRLLFFVDMVFTKTAHLHRRRAPR
jgi:hypothetical protein